jgi:hypothetical protein
MENTCPIVLSKSMYRSTTFTMEITKAETHYSHWVASFVTTEDGKEMQKKVWTQLASKLEEIEPGCVAKALKLD